MVERATVIIPTHNYGRFISSAIQSFFEQDYKNKRLVVVDDGSTDGTEEVVKSIKEDFVYIKNEKSLGPSPARNIAIEASWDYTDVWFNLDGDDYFKPTKMSRFMEVMQDPNYGICYADYDIINQSGQTKREIKPPYSRTRLMQECCIHSGMCFSKAVLEKLGTKKGDPVYDPSLRFCEDWDLELRLTKGCLAHHIAESLTYVRVHGQNLSFLTPSNQEEWNRSWGVIRNRLQNGNY